MADPVIVIGGGPAGQAAAIALASHDIGSLILDEQPRPGGQILRQPPAGFTVARWLPGASYRALKAQLAAFEGSPRCGWRGAVSVVGLAREGDGWSVTLDTGERLAAAHVVVAAGCQDLAVPLPGWTLPGAMAAGAIQAFVKSQQIVPGRRFVLAGTHPLQLVIAAQIVAGGGEVAALCFAQPRARFAAMLSAPLAALRRAPDLAAAAAAWRTLRRARVPIRFATRLEAIEGQHAVTGVRTGTGSIACDTVGLCYGFVPQSALPRMVGAAMRAGGPAGGFATIADDWQQSSLPGLYVAGETTGVAGAAAAMAEGAIAGAAIARALGHAVPDPRGARRALAHHRRFARLLDHIADPRDFFPALAPDTVVCRCEDVTLAAIDAARPGSASSVKLASRCGMGLCQGRNCEPSLLRLLDDPRDPGFTARFPARPVPIGALAD
ncbi:FAD-dependent oxidoreductase [Sphingomonas sp.]